ncbi:MAG: hypothetical protein J5I90_02465 [Caldilineales bacterium]|nr:hypothetical protein [Caldilineales bacterium]
MLWLRWHTLQHKFYDAGGYLAVDLNLLDSSGIVVFTETRSNVADTIPAEVGGNRYAWFTFIDVADGIAVDDHQFILSVDITKDQCKNGGWQSLFKADGSAFKNQGDCIQYVNTGK